MAVYGPSEIVDHDRGTPCGEIQGVQAPEPTTGSGDDDHLFVEVDHSEASLDGPRPGQPAGDKVLARLSTLTVSVPVFLRRAEER